MSEPQRLTPDEVVSRLAERARLSTDQVRALLQAQAELASEQARVDYPVPGIGMLRLMDRPARMAVIPIGPKKGQPIEIPAKKVVKFRVCKMMKDVVFGNPQSMPDLFDPDVFDVTRYPRDEEPED